MSEQYDSCSCDYDPPEFMSQRMRTARKQAKCYECRCPILPGERYEETFGKWYGDVANFKTCNECLELRQWATISVPCFCYEYGNVFECVRDLVQEARADMPPGWIMEWGRHAVKVRQKKRERLSAKPL